MEEKNENVVEETTQDNQQQVEEQKPEIDESKFQSAGDDSVFKVDLSKSSKKEEDAVQEQSTDEVPVLDESDTSEKVVEEVVEEKTEESTEETKEELVLEEITDEQVEEKTEELKVEAEQAIKENVETGKPLPENIQKLMDFMEETGGDLNDYVLLNSDYENLNEADLLFEYYKRTKPHLSGEEIQFLLEDQFSYNEEVDEERDIQRKKLALKEQVADAKNHLDELKSRYYEDIKAGSKLTQEQQKAVDFFNRYNEESKEIDAQEDYFLKKTNELFNDKFKGFEYNIGDKKFRFNVNDVNKVKESQVDVNNFVRKFLDKNNRLGDAKGYHKSLFTAMNADAIANHFYEQGKADALKQSVAKSKNISMNPRQQHSGEINTGGVKFKVVGENSNDFKFKIKNRK